MAEPSLGVRPITEADATSGFPCGRHALDDYFARHAVANDRSGVSKAHVMPGHIEAVRSEPSMAWTSLNRGIFVFSETLPGLRGA